MCNMGLFNDWVVRSGGRALAQWEGTGERDRQLKPLMDEATGAALLPTPEMIVDFLLQVRRRSRIVKMSV